jgi:hypothetical protein
MKEFLFELRPAEDERADVGPTQKQNFPGSAWTPANTQPHVSPKMAQFWFISDQVRSSPAAYPQIGAVMVLTPGDEVTGAGQDWLNGGGYSQGRQRRHFHLMTRSRASACALSPGATKSYVRGCGAGRDRNVARHRIAIGKHRSLDGQGQLSPLEAPENDIKSRSARAWRETRA